MEYWTKRVDELNNIAYDNQVERMEKALVRIYNRCLTETQNDIGKLYDKIEKDVQNGKLSYNSLYQYNRYYETNNLLQERLYHLGIQEEKLLEARFIGFYYSIQDIISKNSPIGGYFIDESRVKQVINCIWCNDKLTWSQRIWRNQDNLRQAIEDTLIECVVRGKKKGDCVKMITEQFNVSYKQADRIVRTEMNFIQNQACADRYQQAGIKKYEYLAYKDEKTCDRCLELNGKVFYFTEMRVGENYPPLHPNTRSTVIPVIEE